MIRKPDASTWAKGVMATYIPIMYNFKEVSEFLILSSNQNEVNTTKTPMSPEHVTTDEDTRQISCSRGVGNGSLQARKCIKP